MKLILTITDSDRKNLFFVTDNLSVISLFEALDQANKNNIENTYVVQRKTGSYLRTKPSVLKKDELESISISAPSLFSAIGSTYNTDFPAIIRRYVDMCIDIERDNIQYIKIKPVGSYAVSIKNIKEKLLSNKKHISDSANYFNIDPYLLSAILIDEIARLDFFENIIDTIGASLVGRNMSVGVAQIKLQTANDLIKKGIYNPNTKDKKLPFSKLDNEARRYLYQYVKDPKYNIFFAGAFVRYVIGFWSKYIDLSKYPEIIATLYHQGYGKPHVAPNPDDRGKQIANEFYQLSKQWLNEKQ
ncbi:MAG: DUF1402 family protein [Candidatus Brennerbacteria bacterium]|nr:DUF1402 family protein [Candidatus Brennerbacteria bacterium]